MAIEQLKMDLKMHLFLSSKLLLKWNGCRA